jgi:predicted transcriptional regulator
MSDKQTVLEAVRKMPDDATIAQIAEEVQILAAIQRSIEAADQGRVISHEEMRRRFESWVSS